MTREGITPLGSGQVSFWEIVYYTQTIHFFLMRGNDCSPEELWMWKWERSMEAGDQQITVFCIGAITPSMLWRLVAIQWVLLNHEEYVKKLGMCIFKLVQQFDLLELASLWWRTVFNWTGEFRCFLTCLMSHRCYVQINHVW